MKHYRLLRQGDGLDFPDWASFSSSRIWRPFSITYNLYIEKLQMLLYRKYETFFSFVGFSCLVLVFPLCKTGHEASRMFPLGDGPF